MSSPYQSWNEQIIDEFRANDGTVTSRPFGRSLVLLHHTGAKTGTQRVNPVMSIAEPSAWLIAASKAGAAENPGWYYNLIAHPGTVIEVPGEGVVAVHVEELKGKVRDDAWEKFTSRSPGFRQYEQNTTRVIPVLALHRRDAPSAR